MIKSYIAIKSYFWNIWDNRMHASLYSVKLQKKQDEKIYIE